MEVRSHGELCVGQERWVGFAADGAFIPQPCPINSGKHGDVIN